VCLVVVFVGDVAIVRRNKKRGSKKLAEKGWGVLSSAAPTINQSADDEQTQTAQPAARDNRPARHG
jgi:hypothetical protein